MMYINWKDRTDGKVANVPINFELPMTDNVKIIVDWIKAYNQKYDIRYVVMYHAAKSNAPILEQGLLAGNIKRKNFGMSENGYVYLAATPKMAKMFGDMAYNGNFTVYEVIVPIGKLLPDKGRLQFTLPDGITDRSLAHSLVYAGSAKIKGNIERWQIKPYEDENRAACKKPTLMERLEQKKSEIKEHHTPGKPKKKNFERS